MVISKWNMELTFSLPISGKLGALASLEQGKHQTLRTWKYNDPTFRITFWVLNGIDIRDQKYITSPHDLGEHVEEVADHPFLELVQLYCTAKPKPKSKYHQDV